MDLIIVESPTKTKTIKRYLGGKYEIVASMGHIRDLPRSKISVDIEKNFQPVFESIPEKKKTISQLKKAIRSAKKVYLATDPDREGEAIAYHVAVIGSNSKKAKTPKISAKFVRVSFHEITAAAIKKAMAKPGQINFKLVDAQIARRVLDRLVGYKLSPLLWKKIRRGLSAGRVQSVALRLIVEREAEIGIFVPVEYWEINCDLKRKIGQNRADIPSFLAKLLKVNGEPLKINDQPQADDIVSELENAGYEVEKVEKKELSKRASPPLITSTLQRLAYSRLGFSAKMTMRTAQSLYEKGLITYHRTDSLNLSTEAIEKIRHLIVEKYGDKFLPATPNFYKNKSKLAQEAHEAIRPTHFKNPKIGKLDQRQSKLFDLIFKRTVASQMTPAVFDQTRVLIQAVGKENVYTLSVTGRIMKFSGWQKVYEIAQAQNQDAKEGEAKLPELTRGDELSLLKVLPEQKFTQPPPRYNDASLVKTLEEKGIGRPSTYASIIATILNRQYIERENKAFKATALGITVSEFLVEYFPKVMDYEFTAGMEDKLDSIAQGKRKWVPVIKEFFNPFNEKLISVTEIAERVAVPTEATGEDCPECKEGQLVIRVGRFGKFISCSRFPDCKYKANYVEKLDGIKCPDCKGDVIIRKTRKGHQFYGCSNYPKCKWASWKKPKE